jgi:hypothetical protein
VASNNGVVIGNELDVGVVEIVNNIAIAIELRHVENHGPIHFL